MTRISTFYKTKGIFEKIVGKPIWLKIIDNETGINFVKQYTDKYYIELYTRSPIVRNDTELYRSFEHELSHIVFNSPSLNKLVEEIKTKLQNVSLPDNMIFDILNILEDHRVDSLWNQIYRGSAIVRQKQLSGAVERCLGYEHVIDPIDALWAVRCGRNDLVDPSLDELVSVYEKALRLVELASPKATAVAAIMVISAIVNFLKSHRQSIDEEQNNADQLLASENINNLLIVLENTLQYVEASNSTTDTDENNSTDDIDTEDDINTDQSDHRSEESDVDDSHTTDDDIDTDTDNTDDVESITDDLGTKDQDDVISSESSSDSTDTTDTCENKEVKDTGSSDTDDTSTYVGNSVTDTTLQDIIDTIPPDIADDELRFLENHMVDKILDTYEDQTNQQDTELLDVHSTIATIIEDAKKEAEEYIEEIKKLIEQIELSTPKPEANVFIDIRPHSWYHDSKLFEPDYATAKKIARCLSRIKLKNRITNDEEGDNIDIDALIERKINKCVTDVFTNEIQDTGFTIAMLVDLSSSMSSNDVMIAATAALTLWEALEKVNNIDFKVYTFCGKKNGDVMYFSEQTKDTLSRVDSYGFTPTDKAIRYTVNLLNKRSGKKLLILLTDGEPCYGGYSFPTLAAWTRSQIRYAHKKGIQVFTFFIGSNIDDSILKEIFGPEYTWEKITYIDQLPKKLFNFVLNKVIKNIS